jgi:phage-related tail fiber protein
MQSLYGLGNGSTTFNVPDFRAQFLRGLDSGAGIDTGRSLGSNQSDMFKSHTHNLANGGVVISTLGTTSAGIVATGVSYAVDTIAPTGGTETRGKNIAVNYGIKY